jgi:hypothetical protein
MAPDSAQHCSTLGLARQLIWSQHVVAAEHAAPAGSQLPGVTQRLPWQRRPARQGRPPEQQACPSLPQAAAWHWPPAHVPSQTASHAPQFRGSVSVSTQEP